MVGWSLQWGWRMASESISGSLHSEIQGSFPGVDIVKTQSISPFLVAVQLRLTHASNVKNHFYSCSNRVKQFWRGSCFPMCSHREWLVCKWLIKVPFFSPLQVSRKRKEHGLRQWTHNHKVSYTCKFIPVGLHQLAQTAHFRLLTITKYPKPRCLSWTITVMHTCIEEKGFPEALE